MLPQQSTPCVFNKNGKATLFNLLSLSLNLCCINEWYVMTFWKVIRKLVKRSLALKIIKQKRHFLTGNCQLLHSLHSVLWTLGGDNVQHTPKTNSAEEDTLAVWRLISAPGQPHVLFSWTFGCFKFRQFESSVKLQRQIWERNSKSERPEKINSTIWQKKPVTRNKFETVCHSISRTAS